MTKFVMGCFYKGLFPTREADMTDRTRLEMILKKTHLAHSVRLHGYCDGVPSFMENEQLGEPS